MSRCKEGAGSLPPRAPTKLILADCWLPYLFVGYFLFLSSFRIILSPAINLDSHLRHCVVNKDFFSSSGDLLCGDAFRQIPDKSNSHNSRALLLEERSVGDHCLRSASARMLSTNQLRPASRPSPVLAEQGTTFHGCLSNFRSSKMVANFVISKRR